MKFDKVGTYVAPTNTFTIGHFDVMVAAAGDDDDDDDVLVAAGADIAACQQC